MQYIVSYTNEEEYVPIILEGPEVLNWKEYCSQFLQEAAKRVLKKKANKYTDGWRDIIDALIEILQEQGYRRVILREVEFLTMLLLTMLLMSGEELMKHCLGI